MFNEKTRKTVLSTLSPLSTDPSAEVRSSYRHHGNHYVDTVTRADGTGKAIQGSHVHFFERSPKWIISRLEWCHRRSSVLYQLPWKFEPSLIDGDMSLTKIAVPFPFHRDEGGLGIDSLGERATTVAEYHMGQRLFWFGVKEPMVFINIKKKKYSQSLDVRGRRRKQGANGCPIGNGKSWHKPPPVWWAAAIRLSLH